jgi:DNA polymerase I-like protein with 3'-5' exonuclease and polymerase domains
MLPNIKTYLTRTSLFGVKNNFIYENGTGRVRWFDKWKTAKKQDYTGEWTYANPEEASGVMRASANFTIQAFGASLLKVAAVLMRRWIYNNHMEDTIKFMIPYHDQLCLYAKDTVAELAKERLEYCMKLAGKLLLKHDLLNATAKISSYWIKD